MSRDVALASDERWQPFSCSRCAGIGWSSGIHGRRRGADPGLILQRVIEEHHSQVDAVEYPELLVQHHFPSKPCWKVADRTTGAARADLLPQAAAESRSDELLQRMPSLNCFGPNRAEQQARHRRFGATAELPIPPVGSRVTTSAISRAVTPPRPGGVHRRITRQAALPQIQNSGQQHLCWPQR